MIGKNERRRFLKVAGAAMGATLIPGGSRAAGPAYRTLGRTGLKVSEVGMGVMITGDPAVVRAALDAGITYFDTARSYMGGRNEEILGRAVSGRRQEAIIATKTNRSGNREGIVRSCEESLRALGTDVIDVFQLHGLSSRSEVIDPASLDALADLKKAGKIRFAGVTTHGGMVEVLDAAIEARVYDVVLTVLNFQTPPEVPVAVERAARAGVGVVAMKVMTGGYTMPAAPGFSPYQSALRWVLSQKGVACAIPSMTTLEQVRDDAAVMGSTTTWRDLAPLFLYARAVGDRYCRMCGECLAQCPRGAAIPDLLRGLMYAEGYGQPHLGKETVAAASPCAGCDDCRVVCRFGLRLPERLATARSLVKQTC